MLKKVGINAELFSGDWGMTTSRRAQKTGWSLIVSSPTGIDVADPLSNFALRTNCDRAWFGWPCDEEIEKLRNAFTEGPSSPHARRSRKRSSCAPGMWVRSSRPASSTRSEARART